MQGASSVAEPKASETGELQQKAARTTEHKQGGRWISRDAATPTAPAHIWADILQGFQLSLIEGRRLAGVGKAHTCAFGRTEAGSAAFAPTHTASQFRDAVFRSLDNLIAHRTAPFSDSASSDSSSQTVPQSATQVPFF